MLHQLVVPGGQAELASNLRTHEVVVGKALQVFRGLRGWRIDDLAAKSGVPLARLTEIESGAFVSLGELMPVMRALTADYPMLRIAELAATGQAAVRVVADPGPKVAK